MKIVIEDKSHCHFVSWSQDDKPSGKAICVKTKDRTVYFSLDTTNLTFHHKLRVMHKGKEYELPGNIYL